MGFNSSTVRGGGVRREEANAIDPRGLVGGIKVQVASVAAVEVQEGGKGSNERSGEEGDGHGYGYYVTAERMRSGRGVGKEEGGDVGWECGEVAGRRRRRRRRRWRRGEGVREEGVRGGRCGRCCRERELWLFLMRQRRECRRGRWWV